MYTDPIADMLTRIRNASMAGKPEAILPYSKIKFKIAEILRDEGYIGGVEKIEDRFGSVRIKLRYENGRPVLNTINRISKPGHRIYAKNSELPHVLNDYGIAIVSTPQGLMTNKQARKKGLGGEIICEVY